MEVLSNMKTNPEQRYPKSSFIKEVIMDKYRFHKGDGDMWPTTWADDDNLYGGAGDNLGSPMNFWRIQGNPPGQLFLVHKLPIDPAKDCSFPAHPTLGIKPAGLICVDNVLYFAVEQMHYGVIIKNKEKSWEINDDNKPANPDFIRQLNVRAWIITSTDYGENWDKEATKKEFFTGRLASPYFLQFGKNYQDARDEYVYAYFPTGNDGNSYWENGDCILLGRADKAKILMREEWEFYSGLKNDKPVWDKDDTKAVPVFEYPLMTGENHVVYNKGIKRYIMGNYGFMTPKGEPRPYHQNFIVKDEETRYPSQLTLFEAPEPWGPWALFYKDDNWGMYGGYQPNFPTKWISEDGRTMHMVSSGTFDDYNFTVQKLILKLNPDDAGI